jgi:hypothetical protein
LGSYASLAQHCALATDDRKRGSTRHAGSKYKEGLDLNDIVSNLTLAVIFPQRNSLRKKICRLLFLGQNTTAINATKDARQFVGIANITCTLEPNKS